MISCICITRDRVSHLERAIECYMAQTYQNRELVIVYEEDDVKTEEFLKEVEDVKKVKVSVKPKLSLGRLRNLGIRKANGKYFCQWDDDDWYHCERLEKQLGRLVKYRRKACLLSQWTIYHVESGKTYLPPSYYWEGSILCERKFFLENIQYKDLTRGEDTPAIDRLRRLQQVVLLHKPYLYVYHIHGQNTWDSSHFKKMLGASEKCKGDLEIVVNHVMKNNIYCRLGSAVIEKAYTNDKKYLNNK